MKMEYEPYAFLDFKIMRNQRFGKNLLRGLRELMKEKEWQYIDGNVRFSCHSINGGRMNFPMSDLSAEEKPEILKKVLDNYVPDGSKSLMALNNHGRLSRLNGSDLVSEDDYTHLEMGFCEPSMGDNRESYDIAFSRELVERATNS